MNALIVGCGLGVRHREMMHLASMAREMGVCIVSSISESQAQPETPLVMYEMVRDSISYASNIMELAELCDVLDVKCLVPPHRKPVYAEDSHPCLNDFHTHACRVKASSYSVDRHLSRRYDRRQPCWRTGRWKSLT